MDFCCRLKGINREGGPSISVGLAEFCSGVAVWWRTSFRIWLILRKRVVP